MLGGEASRISKELTDPQEGHVDLAEGGSSGASPPIPGHKLVRPGLAGGGAGVSLGYSLQYRTKGVLWSTVVP